MTTRTLEQLKNLTFSTIFDIPYTETSGKGKNKGKTYRHIDKITAIDREGAERNYSVQISSDNRVKIEDFGKTREQFKKEEQDAYDKILPETKHVLSCLAFEFSNLCQKLIVADALEGRIKKASLAAALTNKGVRERFQELFPGINTVDEAVKALHKFRDEVAAKEKLS